MSDSKSWDDADCYSLPTYGPRLSFDPSRVGIGLSTSAPDDWRIWDICFYVSADVTRVYELGQLTRIVTPEPALSLELIGELAGSSLAADDTVSMATDLDQTGIPTGAIKLCVNERHIATGYALPDTKTEWVRAAGAEAAKISE